MSYDGYDGDAISDQEWDAADREDLNRSLGGDEDDEPDEGQDVEIRRKDRWVTGVNGKTKKEVVIQVVSLETGKVLWDGPDYVGALNACSSHDWNLIE